MPEILPYEPSTTNHKEENGGEDVDLKPICEQKDRRLRCEIEISDMPAVRVYLNTYTHGDQMGSVQWNLNILTIAVGK